MVHLIKIVYFLTLNYEDFKGYVNNQARPKGCIFERYLIEEATSLYANYLRDTKEIGNHINHNDEDEETISDGKSLVNCEYFNMVEVKP